MHPGNKNNGSSGCRSDRKLLYSRTGKKLKDIFRELSGKVADHSGRKIHLAPGYAVRELLCFSNEYITFILQRIGRRLNGAIMVYVIRYCSRGV